MRGISLLPIRQRGHPRPESPRASWHSLRPRLFNAHSRRGSVQRIVSEMLSLIAGYVPRGQLRRISDPLSTSDTILFVAVYEKGEGGGLGFKHNFN